MAQPIMTQQQPQQANNGLGTAGFVLGLIGLIFSFIPLIGVIAWPMVILGLIFSAIGLNRANKHRATNKGLAIAGLVCSLIGLLMCILYAAVFTKAVNDVNNESNRTVTVHYEVTGDAKGVSISYTVFGDSLTMNDTTAATLPWTKDEQTKGFAKGGSLTVMTGPSGGNVTCKVIVDGKQAKTATASGASAVASCSGF